MYELKVLYLHRIIRYKKMKRPILTIVLFLSALASMAKEDLLSDFPAGQTPLEVGRRIAYHFVDSKHQYWGESKYIGSFVVGCSKPSVLACSACRGQASKQRFTNCM